MLKLTPPKFRRLRVYAFDPVYSRQVETSSFSEVLLEIPWESDPISNDDLLQPGPVGDYLEVVDYDPASQCFYEPVDLNHPWLVAQDGYAPSESNPQFHQQMVYAVAMRTTVRPRKQFCSVILRRLPTRERRRAAPGWCSPACLTM